MGFLDNFLISIFFCDFFSVELWFAAQAVQNGMVLNDAKNVNDFIRHFLK